MNAAASPVETSWPWTRRGTACSRSRDPLAPVLHGHCAVEWWLAGRAESGPERQASVATEIATELGSTEGD